MRGPNDVLRAKLSAERSYVALNDGESLSNLWEAALGEFIAIPSVKIVYSSTYVRWLWYSSKYRNHYWGSGSRRFSRGSNVVKDSNFNHRSFRSDHEFGSGKRFVSNVDDTLYRSSS